MSDNYQAVYDAVSRKIHWPDVDRIIREAFDISWQVAQVKQEFLTVAYEQCRPSILLKPRIYSDGNMWCALYGDDLVQGIAGFGETPQKAMWDFDKNYNEQKPKETL